LAVAGAFFQLAQVAALRALLAAILSRELNELMKCTGRGV
jgi:hypothetical protein